MLSIGQICKENFHPFGDVRIFDLHFRIQTNFGQISSTQRRERKTVSYFYLNFSESSLAVNLER